jgi:hypothetical protein
LFSPDTFVSLEPGYYWFGFGYGGTVVQDPNSPDYGSGYGFGSPTGGGLYYENTNSQPWKDRRENLANAQLAQTTRLEDAKLAFQVAESAARTLNLAEENYWTPAIRRLISRRPDEWRWYSSAPDRDRGC